jgi:TetR/AcrR family transcriptional regulator, cholesterol catabolism regulator
MRDLAEAIGVEAPSLYNHIGSKSEILQEICFRIANIFTAHINEVENNKESFIKKVESIIRFHIKMMIEEYESVYLSDHEWKHLPEPYLSNFKNQRKNYRKRFADIVQNGIDKNEIKNINPYIVVLTILSSIGGIESWQRSSKTINAKELEEDMVKILIQGIEK